MARSVEGQRRKRGFMARTIDVPADLDRRLVHHARVTSTAYEILARRALERECALLDEAEAGSRNPAA